MALPNGVLVHGPSAWACAVRLPGGELKVESGYKRLRSANVENRLLRGPAKLAEVFALLPEIRRRLPEAKLPFERPRVLAAMLGSAVIVRVVRGSSRVGPAVQELVSVAARLRARRLPRRGAHLDRNLRARGEAREGARALWLAHDRATPSDYRARQHRRLPRRRSFPGSRACRCVPRWPRRLHRDLLLDGAQSRSSPRACARAPGSRASAPRGDGRTDSGPARGGRCCTSRLSRSGARLAHPSIARATLRPVPVIHPPAKPDT